MALDNAENAGFDPAGDGSENADGFDASGDPAGVTATLAPPAPLVDPLVQALHEQTQIAQSDPTKPKPIPKPAAAPQPPQPPPQPVQAATYVAAQRDPARWAQVMQLSQRWKVSPEFADRNFDRLSQSVTKQQSDQQLSNVSPTFANWLADPDNATLAQHELAPLAQVDRSTSLLSGAASDVGTATATGMADLASAAGQLAAAYGMTSPATAARFVADMQQRAQSLRSQAPDYAKDYNTAVGAASANLDQSIDALTAGTADQSPGQKVLTVLGRAFTPEAGHTIGDVLDLVRAAATRPRGLAYTGLESIASMAPMLGGAATGAATGAAAGSVVPGIGTAAGGVIGGMTGTFAGMAPVNIGSEITAELTKRGIDVTNADALERAFSDPTVMADIRSKAERAGITNALVASLVSGFAGKLGEAAQESNLATRAAAHAADVSIQAAGMGAGQAAGQAAAGEKVSVGQAIENAIATLGVSAGMEAIGASRRAALHPETAQAAVDATAGADRALQAHADAALLQNIGDAVKEAPTTAQVPDRLRDLVESAAGGADASTVYFQSDDWNRYWQGQGESPADKAAEIMQDGGNGYTEAQATGAPLAIPLADYVARVAPTDHFDGLLGAARMQPDGASLEEAQSYLRDLPATMRDLSHEAQILGMIGETGFAAGKPDTAVELPDSGEARGGSTATAMATARQLVSPDQLRALVQDELTRRGAGEAPTPEAQMAATEEVARRVASVAEQGGDRPELSARLVGVDVEQQLRAAGATATEAKANAALWEHAVRTLAERSNQDPLRLYARYRLRIARGDADAIDAPADTFSQDAAPGAPDRLPPREERGPFSFEDQLRALVESGPLWTKAEGLEARQRAAKVLAALDAAAEREYEQASGGTPRGRIRLGESGINIHLLENADRSTFVHESGHAFLHMLDELGTGEGAPQELAADRAAVRQWLGAEGDAPLTREQHEQFARGFEAYLGEGHAPSQELRGVFFRFQRWLLGVYRDLRALNVNLSDDVRGVFDRLLASHDELEAARRAANVEPLFSDPRAVGLSDEQAARYRDAVNAAQQAAEEEVTGRVMRQLRREDSREWKTLREPIAAEVTRDVDAEPVYQARALMEKGTRPDGSPLPEGTQPFKLSKAAIVGAFGDAVLNGLPRGVYATEGGIHPDVAAEVLGFGTGRALLDALRAAPNRADEIKARTDARMQAEHGARASDAELRDQASVTVRNEKRAQLLRRELEILASDHLATMKGLVRAVTKRVIPSTEAVRQQAETIIGAKDVGGLQPHLYELAARRAATDAREALLRGDVQRAFDAKRRELLNTELLRSATEARETIDGALEQFKQVFRRDDRLADTRDMDLVSAARAILATFGIGASDKPASAYLEQLRRYDPEAYDSVIGMVNDATTNARDYRQLTVDDFHDLHETVSSLWDMSRRSRQIEIEGQKLERHQVQDELTARLQALGGAEGEAIRHAVTSRERAARTLMSARAWLRRVEHWVDQMDGGDPNGVFRRYVWNPISDAATTYRGAKRATTERYLEIVKGIEGKMAGGAIPAPEIGYTFESPAELIGAMLHTGNESNLRKLLVGYGWGTLDENSVVDRSRWDAFVRRMQREGQLTKDHYDYVQRTWDLFEELKPDAQRAHRDMYGRYFDEITANPFTTPWGNYKGGYFPAKADPFRVADQAVKRQAETLLGNDNAFMFPTTGRGFTKSRVEYNRPLIIDAAAVPAALDAVLRFTHLEPHVRDVARIATSRSFRPELDRFDATAGSDMLVPWLQRAAQQRVDVPGKFPALDRFWRELRSRSGMNIMAANAVTALEMIGHAPSAAVKVEPGALGGALWRYMRSPRQFADDVADKSAFMRTRETAAVAEMEKAIDHLMLNPSTYEQARGFAREHGYFLTHGVQNAIDLVVWSGAYEQAARAGVAEAEAVRRADSAVRESQGSFAPEDVSRFESNTPFLRSLSMFYSFFNTKSNLLGTEFANTVRNLGLRKGAGRLLYVYTFGFMIPALMWGMTRNLATSGTPLDEQDDEGPIDPAMRLFFGSQFHMGASMVPIAGPVATSAVDAFTGKQPDALMSSPAVNAIEASARAPHDVYRAIHERMVRDRDIKDVLMLTGLLSGLPVAPLGKPLGYLNRLHTGQAQPANAADVTRGLLTGR